MNYKQILGCILVLSFSTGISFAQDIKPSHFRAIAWNQAITDLVLTQTPPPGPDPQNPSQSLPADADYKETPVSILAVGRSPFYGYDHAKPLYFVRHKGSLFKTVATVDLSNLPDLALLLFVPTTNVDLFNVRVLPDDAKSFPGGSFRFVNMSYTPVTVYLCGRPEAVPPDQIKTVSPHPVVPGKVDMVMVTTKDNCRQYSNLWAVSDQVRYLMFIIENPNLPGRVDCLRLADPVASSTDPNEQKDQAVN